MSAVPDFQKVGDAFRVCYDALKGLSKEEQRSVIAALYGAFFPDFIHAELQAKPGVPAEKKAVKRESADLRSLKAKLEVAKHNLLKAEHSVQAALRNENRTALHPAHSALANLNARKDELFQIEESIRTEEASLLA